jgi:hypothetical protein
MVCSHVTATAVAFGELVDAALAQPAGMPFDPTPGPMRRTHHRGEGLPADRRPFRLVVIQGRKVRTLVFHQGVLTLFYFAGAFPRALALDTAFVRSVGWSLRSSVIQQIIRSCGPSVSWR